MKIFTIPFPTHLSGFTIIPVEKTQLSNILTFTYYNALFVSKIFSRKDFNDFFLEIKFIFC